MSAMAGQASRGREIATEVITLLQEATDDFWKLATLGEAFMLTKNRQKSVEHFIQARKHAGNDGEKSPVCTINCGCSIILFRYPTKF